MLKKNSFISKNIHWCMFSWLRISQFHKKLTHFYIYINQATSNLIQKRNCYIVVISWQRFFVTVLAFILFVFQFDK